MIREIPPLFFYDGHNCKTITSLWPFQLRKCDFWIGITEEKTAAPSCPSVRDVNPLWAHWNSAYSLSLSLRFSLKKCRQTPPSHLVSQPELEKLGALRSHMNWLSITEKNFFSDLLEISMSPNSKMNILPLAIDAVINTVHCNTATC